MLRQVRLFLLGFSILLAQESVDFICPMDPDVRSKAPGRCPRCGMKLVAGIPEPLEYPVHLKVKPRNFKPGDKVELSFAIDDPKTKKPVQKFQEVHEKLFHMFLVSQDLSYFVHDHPSLGADSIFRFNTVLPKPGPYRVLCDFYPEGGTPQLIARTVIAPGGRPREEFQVPKIAPDLKPKQAANLEVELVTEPPHPIAGTKTLLFFRLKPADGLEQYLGAWGHMLAASDDLIDLIHNHPFIADGGPQVQFNLLFPRARTYRLWVQFQRKGVVNTAVFDVPVASLQ